ncbi:AMP-binding protein [Bacillus cereus]|uniref:AMP-binding protein n=1 Tax=Bacillus cereus TaxID=1396 RepID=UPI001F5C888E|nr:AMP-binding protein [Bacillus cereus]
MQTLIINKNVPLQDVDLLLPQDYALYQKTDRSLANYSVSKTLDQLIDEQANKNPSCIAMTIGKHILTYQELRVQSNQVAQALLQKGLKKQERVSILMNRCIDAIVAMIDVLKAGGTYVPINPDFPVDRIHFILQDSESTHIITNQKTNLPCNSSNTSIIMYETLSKQIVTEQLQSQHTPYDAAYIIYTSGSTGTPKECWFHIKVSCNLSIHYKASMVFKNNRYIYNLLLLYSMLRIRNNKWYAFLFQRL